MKISLEPQSLQDVGELRLPVDRRDRIDHQTGSSARPARSPPSRSSWATGTRPRRPPFSPRDRNKPARRSAWFQASPRVSPPLTLDQQQLVRILAGRCGGHVHQGSVAPVAVRPVARRNRVGPTGHEGPRVRPQAPTHGVTYSSGVRICNSAAHSLCGQSRPPAQASSPSCRPRTPGRSANRPPLASAPSTPRQGDGEPGRGDVEHAQLRTPRRPAWWGWRRAGRWCGPARRTGYSGVVGRGQPARSSSRPRRPPWRRPQSRPAPQVAGRSRQLDTSPEAGSRS